MTHAILSLLLFTAEALALSTLLPLLVFAVALSLRRRAALRHLVWLAVFAMLLLAPALALIVPSQFVLAQAPLADMPALPVAVAMAAPVTATYVHEWSFDQIVALLFAPLCAIWLLGVAWNLMRLGLGAYGLRRLRGRSEYFDTMQNCELRLADGGPLTYGWIKPVILLPHAARRWSRARLDLVLRHEMAHVRRKDSLTQTLVQLVCAFYWPNPLVWLAAKALRREAEIAADDSVLASGLKPSSYAAELLQLAGELRAGPRLVSFGAGVAMAAPTSLESRVTAVLSPTVSRQGATAMDALKIAALGSCATALLLVTRPSFAEVRKPLPAPTQLAAPSVMAQPGDAPAPVAQVQEEGVPAPAYRARRSARAGRAMPDEEMQQRAERAQERGQAAQERAQEKLQAMQERMQERAQERAQAAQEKIQAAQERVENAHQRAVASLEHAKEASDRALSPEKVERIVAHAQERAQAAMAHYDEAMQRAEQAHRTAPPGINEQEWRDSFHRSLEQGRPNLTAMLAQVREQVRASLAAARASRDAALVEARAEIDRSLAQARARAQPVPVIRPVSPLPYITPPPPAPPAPPAPPPPT